MEKLNAIVLSVLGLVRGDKRIRFPDRDRSVLEGVRSGWNLVDLGRRTIDNNGPNRRGWEVFIWNCKWQ